MEKEEKKFSLTFHTYKLYVLHNKTDMRFYVANLCLIYFPLPAFIGKISLRKSSEVDKSALNDNLIKRHRFAVRTK